MRIRSIKPEFYRSDDIDALCWDDRLVFIGLWSYVDDNGVGVDKLASITADLFSGDLERDPRETFARVTEAIRRLAEAGLIVRYEADGKRLLFITEWDSHQRIDHPAKARYTRPTSANTRHSREPRETVAKPRESVAPGTGEQRNRGTEEQGLEKTSSATPLTRPRSADSFDLFWQTYPRRTGKDAARRAFTSARKRATAEALIAGAARFAEDPNREDAFTPHPATWLNAGRWADETMTPARPNPAARPSTTDARVSAGLDLAAQLRAEELAAEAGARRLEIAR